MAGVNLALLIVMPSAVIVLATIVYVFMGVKIKNMAESIKTGNSMNKEASEKIIEETNKEISKLKCIISSAGSCPSFKGDCKP